METERVVADAAKKAGKQGKRFAKGFGKFLGEVGEGLAAAERMSEERRRAREASARNVVAAYEAHVRQFGTAPLVEVPMTYRKCTGHTAFWDCEDPNCFRHQSQKDKMGIGTPTRDYRKSTDE